MKFGCLAHLAGAVADCDGQRVGTGAVVGHLAHRVHQLILVRECNLFWLVRGEEIIFLIFY